MADREIVVDGDPVLRRRARTVRRFGTALQDLVNTMFDTLRAANGLGLAAPQIGVSERVIVVEIPEDTEDESGAGTSVALVNPEIVKARGEQLGPEGCLSVPGFYGDVRRALQVTVKGRDPQGREVRMKADGLLARALQHEIDHLEGVLFIDLAEPGTMQYVGEEDVEGLVDGEAQPTVTEAPPGSA